MSFKLEQSWKVLISLDETSPNYYAPHELFSLESGNNFLRKIGGGMECFLISPLVLRPTIVFCNAISRIIKKAGFTGNKFPYKKNEDVLNIITHSYFEKYIVLTVRYTKTYNSQPTNLSEITILNNHPEIYKLILSFAGIIKNGDYKNITPLTSIPTLRCTLIEMFDGDFYFEKNQLIESLTGHMQPVQNIVDDVLERNKGHQLNEALTLIDKQGVIQNIPYDFSGKNEAQKKYISCCNLFELMIVINRTIQDDYLGANRLFIKALAALVRNPERVVNSFTARKTIEQFTKDFHLVGALTSLESEAYQQIQLDGNMNVQSRKRISFKEGFLQFYASKEFFAVLLTVAFAGITSGLGVLWAFLKS
ncbi:hypothetical protein ACSJLZ_003253 [Serratia bockelmannii]|uniref:hypothetical protein n=1 Tax=Serratia bockelmannii TaxID=2703793 RepID=UPI003F6CDE29